MIIFRADVNPQIGTGHIMRCIAIAKAAARLGEEVLFVTADDWPAAFLRQAGLCYMPLHTRFDHPEEETAALLHVLSEHGADSMLADSYYVTADYFERLQGRVRTAYMDDFANEMMPADMVINYNITADPEDYRRLYAGRDTKVLAGTQYTPLRSEFCGIAAPPLRSRMEHLLITTGGTDPLGMSALLTQRILRDPDLQGVTLHVAAGRFYTGTKELLALAEQSCRLKVLTNPFSMAELMLRCDAAVSAAGTTLYELCACGLPAVIFSFADNQTHIREGFGRREIMLNCGDARGQEDECANRMIEGVKSLVDAEKRKILRERAQSVTNGQGAAHIAEHLISLRSET